MGKVCCLLHLSVDISHSQNHHLALVGLYFEGDGQQLRSSSLHLSLQSEPLRMDCVMEVCVANRYLEIQSPMEAWGIKIVPSTCRLFVSGLSQHVVVI